MRKYCTPESSFLYRIFLFLIALISGLFLTFVVFLILSYVQSGFDPSVFKAQTTDWSGNVNLLRQMQVLQSFFVFILPPFILARLYKEKPETFLHLRRPGWKASILGMSSILFMIPLINVLVSWNAGLHLPESLQGLESMMRASEESAFKVTQVMLKGTAWHDLVINLIIVGLLAGVGEELFFRGLIQSMVLKVLGHGKKPAWTMHVTIWTVAVLFSAIHLQFFGFVPRLLLGAWFGYLLWWTGSIWVPVLAHFTNNALSTLATYSLNKGLLSENPDGIGLGETWWLCLISIFLLAGCAYSLRAGKRI